MKSQFLGRNDKETGTFTGNTRKLSLRSEPKSAWVPNTPSAHKLLIFERQILFSVQLSRASCQQITSKCEVSLHHALHHAYHAYHASYRIILDHRKTSVDSPRVPKANQGRLHTTQITSDLAALEPVRDSLQDSPGTLSETPSSFHVA